MNESQILREFEEAEAILHGHFILTSGLRTGAYIQCARVMMDPNRGERLCKELAFKVKANLGIHIDLVVSPALGGIIVGYEVARHLHVPAVFCERVDGKFQLRRGFDIKPDSNILLVEDVVTTGKSSLETVSCIANHGGKVIAEACFIDRTGKNDKSLPFPLISLIKMDIKTYSPDNLPAELDNIPATKPGSRQLKI